MRKKKKRLHCRYCEQSFPSKSGLKCHMEYCHRSELTPPVCFICGKVLGNRDTVKCKSHRKFMTPDIIIERV